MMKITKANCRGVRELVGLSQSDLAKRVGVTVETIKGCESPKRKQYSASRRIWAQLEKTLEDHIETINSMLDTYESLGDEGPIVLNIYRDQAEFEALNGKKGNFAVVNRNTLTVAEILILEGKEVEFSYPSYE